MMASFTEYDYNIVVDLMFATGANVHQCIDAYTKCGDFTLSMIYINLKYNGVAMGRIDENGNKIPFTDEDYLEEVKRRVF